MNVIMYTTHCPRCEVLKTKLLNKKITFEEETSVVKMKELGIDNVPVLSINGDLKNFTEAIKWINEVNE